ncbi:MAG: DUF86 domain-containing protein [Planctomycetota bacterium]|nr:DUF86 domain-containing protein [Planctomycetota bacterium]
MPPEQRDPAYLWDMLDAAKAVCQITVGVRYDQYLANRTLQLAVERAIEIIGEAARRVSEATQNAHPEIPWRPIIAQRHVLAHEYGEIREDRIWRVATVHVPELIPKLESLLPNPPSVPGNP